MSSSLVRLSGIDAILAFNMLLHIFYIRKLSIRIKELESKLEDK